MYLKCAVVVVERLRGVGSQSAQWPGVTLDPDIWR